MLTYLKIYTTSYRSMSLRSLDQMTAAPMVYLYFLHRLSRHSALASQRLLIQLQFLLSKESVVLLLSLRVPPSKSLHLELPETTVLLIQVVMILRWMAPDQSVCLFDLLSFLFFEVKQMSPKYDKIEFTMERIGSYFVVLTFDLMGHRLYGVQCC